MNRYILKCTLDDLLLAARAAKYGETEMPNDCAVIVYGERGSSRDFFVKRTKTGFSVTGLTLVQS